MLYKIHFTTVSSLPIRFLASSAAASQIFLRTAGESSSWIKTKICSLTAFWMFAGTWGQNSSKLFANRRRSSTGASVLTWSWTNSKIYIYPEVPKKLKTLNIQMSFSLSEYLYGIVLVVNSSTTQCFPMLHEV